MHGRGNKELRVRLPADHWVWSVQDPFERNAEVRRALDWYWRYRKQFEAVPPSVMAEMAAHLEAAIAVLQDFVEHLYDVSWEIATNNMNPDGRARQNS